MSEQARARPRRLVVVVGTGTEVGKTWISARLLEQWRKEGLAVAARKPAQSFALGEGPTDAEVLGAASGEPPDTVCLPERSYPLPVAPPMAARRLGLPALTVDTLLETVRWPDHQVDVGLVETAGGLRSPQADDADAMDLVHAFAPDMVLLVADAGLGTIHAVRSAAVALYQSAAPFVVVLNRYDSAEMLHQENLDWLRNRDGLDVVPGNTPGMALLVRQLAGDDD